jgi:hypothetical protein
MMDGTMVERAARVVVAARDFLGDEKAALRQWADDEGIRLFASDVKAVRAMADDMWRESQLAAGVVRPVDEFERRSIEKIMNRAV